MKAWLMGLAVALLTAPGALAAQEAPAQQADSHERLYDALQSGVDDTVALERGLGQIRELAAGLPQFVELEGLRPGALDEIIALVRPIMREQSNRVEAEYRPRMIAVFRSGLSSGEAAELAAFYASPLGRRVLAALSANVQSRSVVNSAINEEAVSSADVRADMRASESAAFGSLSQSDRDQLVREVTARPSFAKLSPLMQKIAALRAKMESEPFNEAEQARFDAALEEAFALRN